MTNLLIIPFLLVIYLSYKLGHAIGVVKAESKFRHELWLKYKDTPSNQVESI